MKHVPSCRSVALITAATGTVLVTTAFGVLPAVAATDAPQPVSASTVSSSPAPDTTPATTAPAADTAGTTEAVSAPATSDEVVQPPAPVADTTAPASAAPAPVAPSTAAPATDAPAPASPATASGSTAVAPSAAGVPAPAASAAATAEDGSPAEPAAAVSGPSYDEGTDASSPRWLPTVRAGESFSADLRAHDAEDATYTLTTVEGTDVALDSGLTFRDGLLEGTATTAGTFTVRVTATTDHGSASQWVRQVVEPAAVVAVGVVVHGVPAAADGSYTWVAGDGTVGPRPISVPVGGSITLVPWTVDEYGNPANATDRAEVWASGDTDQVVHGEDGFTVTFPHASTHTIWVSVDGVCTEFTVEVVDDTAETPTTPTEPGVPTEPTVPTDPTTPVPPVDVTPDDATPQDGGTAPVVRVTPTASDAVAAPVAARTTPVAHELAWTGAETAAPIGWAAALLAAGAGLFALRRARRSRHRA